MKIWIDRCLLGLHVMGAALLAALVVVVCYDVIGRLLFNKPFAGTAELTGAGLVLLTFMQMPYAMQQGKLLRVTFFVDLLPAKLSDAFSALAWCIGTTVLMVFFVAGWGPALEAWGSGEFYGNDAFRLPASPLRFGTLFLWLMGSAVCIGLVIQAVQGKLRQNVPQH